MRIAVLQFYKSSWFCLVGLHRTFSKFSIFFNFSHRFSLEIRICKFNQRIPMTMPKKIQEFVSKYIEEVEHRGSHIIPILLTTIHNSNYDKAQIKWNKISLLTPFHSANLWVNIIHRFFFRQPHMQGTIIVPPRHSCVKENLETPQGKYNRVSVINSYLITTACIIWRLVRWRLKKSKKPNWDNMSSRMFRKTPSNSHCMVYIFSETKSSSW